MGWGKPLASLAASPAAIRKKETEYAEHFAGVPAWSVLPDGSWWSELPTGWGNDLNQLPGPKQYVWVGYRGSCGRVGVTVLSLNQNNDGSLTFHNQHHWVTASGDTINLEHANATGYPTGVQGLYAAIYSQGTTVAGGTGKFENATGTISVWGAVNPSKGEVILRYEGTVCYAKK